MCTGNIFTSSWFEGLPLLGLKAWLSHQTSGSPKRLHPNLRFEPRMWSFFGSENLEKDVEKPWKNTIWICRDHFPKRFPHGFSPSGISIHSECSFVSSLNFNMSCTRNHQKSLIVGEDNSHFMPLLSGMIPQFSIKPSNPHFLVKCPYGDPLVNKPCTPSVHITNSWDLMETVHPTPKNGIFIGIDPYPYVNWNSHAVDPKKLHVLPVNPLNPPVPSSFNLVMSVSHLPVAGDFWLFFEKKGFNMIQPAKNDGFCWWISKNNLRSPRVYYW